MLLDRAAIFEIEIFRLSIDVHLENNSFSIETQLITDRFLGQKLLLVLKKIEK